MDFNQGVNSRTNSAEGILPGNEFCSATLPQEKKNHWTGYQISLIQEGEYAAGRGFIMDLGKRKGLLGFMLKNDNYSPNNDR